MLYIYLKYQIRNVVFFIPFLFIPLSYLTDNYIYAFTLFQLRFFNLFMMKDFFLKFYLLTGCSLPSLIYTHNFTSFISFNFFFIISLTISGNLDFIEILIFNSILFTAFILGFFLNNSDFSAKKSFLFKNVLLPIFFNTPLFIIFFLLKSIRGLTNYHLWYHLLVLILLIIAWSVSIRLLKRLNKTVFYLNILK